MAPRKKNSSDMLDEVKDTAPAEPLTSAPIEESFVAEFVETKKSTVGRKKSSRKKRMNFDSYARRKGFKPTHIPGRKAYCKNPNIPRTLEEWDAFFKAY